MTHFSCESTLFGIERNFHYLFFFVTKRNIGYKIELSIFFCLKPIFCYISGWILWLVISSLLITTAEWFIDADYIEQIHQKQLKPVYSLIQFSGLWSLVCFDRKQA